ncbi:MAG: transketolase [Pseudomonadota bacterium]|nr:transketolase [Pseudomonadota bacterium]
MANTDANHSGDDLPQLANAIRVLSIDAVEQAKSGHPGMPMGMADVATTLYANFLKFDPSRPEWADRDRLVLSAGHGSMLLYSLLYLTGYPDMTLEQLMNFRQLGSSAAGHPEYGLARGIETTTGPLGQGLANAVGMALAEQMMAARFGKDLVDHRTYVIAGDGCLMEGISHEAASLAGHLRLSKLTLLFDDNSISIDGPTSLTTSDDQLARFSALGWHVQKVDGHNNDAISNSLIAAKEDPRPSFIACETIIGKGAPTKKGTAAVHGAPLGKDEVEATKEALDWPRGSFEVPEHVLSKWRQIGSKGVKDREQWDKRAATSAARPLFEASLAGTLPDGINEALAGSINKRIEESGALATRKASEQVLETINAEAGALLVGGSADLTGSNNTKAGDMSAITHSDFSGNYIHYGVREHAMGAVMNGIALHKGPIPYGGTFLVFSDYARPAMRLSALMGLRVIYVMTHDSIGLGEDGPTHQPVEHLSALRSIPNLAVFRPADLAETAECWLLALGRESGPSVIALTRQNVPHLRDIDKNSNLCATGAYEIRPAGGECKVSILASGSEVDLAIKTQTILENAGIWTKVISMPCWEILETLNEADREDLLGGTCLRVGIEAASRPGWDRWLGSEGLFFGLDGFGASAPYQDLYKHFGLTAEHISEVISEKF